MARRGGFWIICLTGGLTAWSVSEQARPVDRVPPDPPPQPAAAPVAPRA